MKTRRTVWTFSRSEPPANETEPALQRSKSTIMESGQSCVGEYDNPCFETSSCHSFGRDTEPLTKESPKHKRMRNINPLLWRFPEQVPSQNQDVEEDRHANEERLTESPSYNSSDVESNLSKTSIELSSDDLDDDSDDDDDLVGDEVLVIEESVM